MQKISKTIATIAIATLSLLTIGTSLKASATSPASSVDAATQASSQAINNTINQANNAASSASAQNTQAPQMQTQIQTAPLTVTQAVARPSKEGSKHSAAYLILHNNSDKDINILNASAMDIANHVELHDVVKGDKGVMKMTKIDHMVVPVGGNLVMQPGKLHIMLMNLKKPLKVGDKFYIELNTKELGTQTVEVEVVNM